MSPRPARAKSAQPSDHHIPLGLAVTARALMSLDNHSNPEAVKADLIVADQYAQKLLADPIVTLQHPADDFPAMLKNTPSYRQMEADAIAAIEKGYGGDSAGMVFNIGAEWGELGLLIGLCLGYRAASCGREGGVR